jgi:hypothetical protein
MSKLHYLAYGSNLHPVRLKERVPSARPLGWVALPGCRLTFHTVGQDGSGKCDLRVTREGGDTAYAALYELAAAEKPALDEAEGPPYRIETWEVGLEGQRYSAFVYLARTEAVDAQRLPFVWYRDVVTEGARYMGFPARYVARIGHVTAREDPDEARCRRHRELLSRMAQWQPEAG